jgi:hypothetical protein
VSGVTAATIWQPVEIRAGHLFFSFFMSFSFRVSREDDEDGEGEGGAAIGRERFFNSLLAFRAFRAFRGPQSRI